jgi:hypothetical protein
MSEFELHGHGTKASPSQSTRIEVARGETTIMMMKATRST